MIESDLATYLEQYITVPITVGKRLPETDDSVVIFSVGSLLSNAWASQLDQLQISVRATEPDKVSDLVETIVSNIKGFYGLLGQERVTLFINSITGDIYEDDGRIVHRAILVNLKR